ncbi:MAG: hypothetical protein DRJ34_00450 [Thermoprotei archaeon]|nr:MAG: hypothetical protein DRJ34_00450 [Thermoprotei archaeon]
MHYNRRTSYLDIIFIVVFLLLTSILFFELSEKLIKNCENNVYYLLILLIMELALFLNLLVKERYVKISLSKKSLCILIFLFHALIYTILNMKAELFLVKLFLIPLVLLLLFVYPGTVVLAFIHNILKRNIVLNRIGYSILISILIVFIVSFSLKIAFTTIDYRLILFTIIALTSIASVLVIIHIDSNKVNIHLNISEIITFISLMVVTYIIFTKILVKYHFYSEDPQRDFSYSGIIYLNENWLYRKIGGPTFYYFVLGLYVACCVKDLATSFSLIHILILLVQFAPFYSLVHALFERKYIANTAFILSLINSGFAFIHVVLFQYFGAYYPTIGSGFVANLRLLLRLKPFWISVFSVLLIPAVIIKEKDPIVRRLMVFMLSLVAFILHPYSIILMCIILIVIILSQVFHRNVYNSLFWDVIPIGISTMVYAGIVSRSYTIYSFRYFYYTHTFKLYGLNINYYYLIFMTAGFIFALSMILLVLKVSTKCMYKHNKESSTRKFTEILIRLLVINCLVFYICLLIYYVIYPYHVNILGCYNDVKSRWIYIPIVPPLLPMYCGVQGIVVVILLLIKTVEYKNIFTGKTGMIFKMLIMFTFLTVLIDFVLLNKLPIVSALSGRLYHLIRILVTMILLKILVYMDFFSKRKKLELFLIFWLICSMAIDNIVVLDHYIQKKILYIDDTTLKRIIEIENENNYDVTLGLLPIIPAPHFYADMNSYNLSIIIEDIGKYIVNIDNKIVEYNVSDGNRRILVNSSIFKIICSYVYLMKADEVIIDYLGETKSYCSVSMNILPCRDSVITIETGKERQEYNLTQGHPYITVKNFKIFLIRSSPISCHVDSVEHIGWYIIEGEELRMYIHSVLTGEKDNKLIIVVEKFLNLRVKNLEKEAIKSGISKNITLNIKFIICLYLAIILIYLYINIVQRKYRVILRYLP